MKRHRILHCFLCGMVFIAAMIPFVQVANYGLVNCDDLFYVGANSFVMNGVSVDAVKKALVDTSLAIWMPLTWISYMVDVEVVRGLGACGMPVSEAGVMHIHSVLIHGVDAVLLFVLLFCITIGPSLGLANFGYHAFADRFTYIPSLGVALAVALLLRSAMRLGRLGHGDVLCKVAMACGFVVVVTLGAGAFHQTRYWANDEVLFQHVLEVEGGAQLNGASRSW